MILFYTFVFILSCCLLIWSGKWLISGLTGVARFLEWREFVVAFFIMAIAGSVPNLFVGFSSVLHGIPELSFGDIVGGNLLDLTVVIALGALIAKNGLPAKSRMVQTTSIFTIVVTILPLLLILDGTLGRGDGIVLISVFLCYMFWLFSKKERFSRVYDGKEGSAVKEFKIFIKDFGKIIFGVALLLLAAEGIVRSSLFFVQFLDIPIVLVGIFIIGFGNSLPEIYFTIASARSGKTWLILGNLMGSVIVPVTLVLGTVAIICPIEITDFSPFIIARFFLIISAVFFFFFVRTDRRITRKEAAFLLGLYASFALTELFFH